MNKLRNWKKRIMPAPTIRKNWATNNFAASLSLELLLIGSLRLVATGCDPKPTALALTCGILLLGATGFCTLSLASLAMAPGQIRSRAMCIETPTNNQQKEKYEK